MRHAALARSLRAFSRRVPFVPYTIELNNGQSIAVSHPEAVVLVGRTVVCRESNRAYRVFDSTSICELHDVPRTRPTV
jgi:hypothetical protein